MWKFSWAHSPSIHILFEEQQYTAVTFPGWTPPDQAQMMIILLNYTQWNSSWFCLHWGEEHLSEMVLIRRRLRKGGWSWGGGGSRNGETFGKLLSNINSATFYCYYIFKETLNEIFAYHCF